MLKVGELRIEKRIKMSNRKHNVKEINLQVDDFEPFVNDDHVGFIISWSSDIGWGEYTVYKDKDSDQWYGDSECMDRGDDKEFISELMRLFIEKMRCL